jgi:hypothetical protein
MSESRDKGAGQAGAKRCVHHLVDHVWPVYLWNEVMSLDLVPNIQYQGQYHYECLQGYNKRSFH